tara:strand:- start:126 stop:695 length:570 start_codon:yes stop_codon:yes gene_type:complete
MKVNLKKLVYQYRYLKLELDELKEQQVELTIEFESEFSDIIKDDGKIQMPETKDTKTKSVHTDESVKDIYKKTAKKLHPDKGGDEEEFKELNKRYKSNDLLGVIDLAVDNKIEIDYSEDDVKLMNISVESLKTNIEDYKNKIAYVWKYGTTLQRKQVLGTLSKHLGRTIDVEDLTDEQKIKIGIDLDIK